MNSMQEEVNRAQTEAVKRLSQYNEMFSANQILTQTIKRMEMREQEDKEAIRYC